MTRPCVILICLFMQAVTASAQERPPRSVDFAGTEAFGHILHSFHLQPLASLDEAQRAPEDTLLIAFGKVTQQGPFDLDNFLGKGGALLLASDFALASRPPLHLTSPGDEVFATESAYQQTWQMCPLVTKFTDLQHPLFKGLKRGIATNRPSFLQGTAARLTRLAIFSPDCGWHRPNRPDSSLPADAGYIFGSPATARPAGRCVLLAGQGVFFNGMLIQPDNDNFAFARNAISWLAEGPTGPRRHVCFLDGDKVITNLALPLRPIGPLPVPPIQVINQIIRGLEDENIFNRLLLANVGKEAILRLLVILGSAALLLMGARRLLQGRYRVDRRVPLVISKSDSRPSLPPLLARRQEELARLGNLWEPAQVLARQFFLDHAGITAPLWDEKLPGVPAQAVGGSFWERRGLNGQFRSLWKLACSSPDQRVSPRSFDKLLRTLADLHRALAEGRASFTG